MRIENSKDFIKNILNNQKYGVIASQEKNKVFTNLIAFYSSDDLKNIYFVTSKKSNKYKNLINNPNISILIDNRKNNIHDIINTTAISAIGVAHEINSNISNLTSNFIKKHPGLSDFILSPDSIFFDIKVLDYIFVSKFDNKEIIKI